MSKYGYIINASEHTTETGEVTWSFQRKAEDGSITNFTGIEYTTRTNLANIVTKGNAVQFNKWLIEHGRVYNDII